jgi:hypothetical protein
MDSLFYHWRDVTAVESEFCDDLGKKERDVKRGHGRNSRLNCGCCFDANFSTDENKVLPTFRRIDNHVFEVKSLIRRSTLSA